MPLWRRNASWRAFAVPTQNLRWRARMQQDGLLRQGPHHHLQLPEIAQFQQRLAGLYRRGALLVAMQHHAVDRREHRRHLAAGQAWPASSAASAACCWSAAR